jgi:GxxExxY protein
MIGISKEEKNHGIHGRHGKNVRMVPAYFLAEGVTVALLYEQETYRILGACFEVYKEKGCGFLEAVYQECLEIEMELQQIPFFPHKILRLCYKDRPLKQTYEPDFTCFETVILKIKAVSDLVDEHRAQLHNYLKATGYRVGLLANFGHYPKLQHERIIR